MGRDQTLCESSEKKIISCFSMLGELWNPWMTIFLIFVILSEKLAKSWVISHEIAKITEIGREQDFTI